jgi:hypothetical protein
MGKSFWTHALISPDIRSRLAEAYSLPSLAETKVVIGFNGSEKIGAVAPTIEELSRALGKGLDPEIIWRAVFLRAMRSVVNPSDQRDLDQIIAEIILEPARYAEELSETDNLLSGQNKSLIVVFDALDRLASNWAQIQILTRALLVRSLGLQSFRSIRAKIFIRVDQYADPHLFTFPDSSKLKNDHVSLMWKPNELFALLFFELIRDQDAHRNLMHLAERLNIKADVVVNGRLNSARLGELAALVAAIAGEFMGGHKKRGRVFSWVPLHLSDADNNCSPRTFLTAWKSAADHTPHPTDKVVDHLGLIEGVRHASATRLTELKEDYPWIQTALSPLRRQFVPILRDDLFALWNDAGVLDEIAQGVERKGWIAPAEVVLGRDQNALLNAMTSIAVMEERSNQKINVPDIFRVEAGILRKGGVAVPRKV